MTQTGDDFFGRLRDMARQGKRIPLAEDVILKAWIDTDDSITFTDHTPEIEARALGTEQYLAVYPNQVSNPDFDSDLTSWTEDIDANITATTAHHDTQGEVFAEQGNIGSLQIDVTVSAATGQASRKQVTLPAAAAEVWNFEAYMKGSAFTNATGRLRIIWSGGAEASVTSVDVGGGFIQMKLENQTAPGGTTSVDIYLEIDVTTSGGTGKAWFGKVRAERASGATITERARRMIAGDFVCRT